MQVLIQKRNQDPESYLSVYLSFVLLCFLFFSAILFYVFFIYLI